MTSKQPRPKRGRRRLWIWLAIAIVLLGALVAGGLAAKQLYDQAMAVRGHLESAMTEVKEVQRAVLVADLDAASAASDRLSLQTKAAVSRVHGRLWGIGEHVPFIGDDLAAVRVVVEATDRLATDVVAPAGSVSLDGFRPHEGRIDLEAIEALVPLLDRMDQGVDEALASLAQIDQSSLIPQVATGVQQLDNALVKIKPMIEPVRNVVGVLPDALGASGPRNYLLMFQGNSEARSLGGNAAVFIVLHADDGALSIAAHVTSQDFRNILSEPVVPLDPEAVHIYGDKIGRYTADFTMVPDFSTAVGILEGWWQRESFPPADGVMSFDPVALSYALRATGPVTLPTGDTLTADNAVSLLLNEVYFRYTDPLEQNAFFTAAANAVFAQVIGGDFAPVDLMSALSRAADEGRLLYQSDDPVQAELIAQTRMAGVLPHDNETQTAIGVYVNDNTGSKMSYYLDMAIDVCRGGSSVRGTTTLTSTVTPEQAAELPPYITGPYYQPGDISTYVVLYGPPGSAVSQVTLDGAPADIIAAGQHLGRPAVKIEVLSHLVSTHSISFAFAGVVGTGPLSVWHTPMVRGTDVEALASCAG